MSKEIYDNEKQVTDGYYTQGLPGIFHEIMDMQRRLSVLEVNCGTAEKTGAGRTENVKADFRRADESAQMQTLNEKITSLTEENKNVKKKIQTAVAEKDRTAHENEKLKAEISELTSQLSGKDREIDNLRDFAYKDRKTGVQNENAFNRDVKGAKLNRVCLVILSMCDIRFVNMQVGKKKADKLICAAADAIKEHFDATDVYRIMGDQFWILTENRYEDIKTDIDEVIGTLADVNISVISLYISGNECQDIRDMIKKAESALNELRKKKAGQQPAQKKPNPESKSPQKHAEQKPDTVNEPKRNAESIMDRYTNTEESEKEDSGTEFENWDMDDDDSGDNDTYGNIMEFMETQTE